MTINSSQLDIVVLVPCYNEGKTIHTVIQQFKYYLPEAAIYIFDNNSSDNTVEQAKQAGAFIRNVTLQGKGNVIRRMFADIDADIYVMVDGDATYEAKAVPKLVEMLKDNHLDMVVGARKTEEELAYRFGHRSGNKLLTYLIELFFGHKCTDLLSGYRVFSKRFVKSFPAHSAGFEIETELTLHAYQLKMPVAEVITQYCSRPEGSFSKLNTYRDGSKIFFTIFKLFKNERPFLFFFICFALCTLLALILAIPIFKTFIATGLVPRFPTAILCASLIVLGVILLVCGIILHDITKMRLEIKQNAYLSVR
ncbi:MAG: glycosyltransferase family 2 protein [Pseudomonadota bacterium]